jgi:hypothetical protein
LRELVIPAFFTLFGAGIGFIASQIKDYAQARRAEKSFLRAVRMELGSLNDQLSALVEQAVGATSAVAGRSPMGPQFATAFRTSIFTNQIGKLRDLDDSVLIEVVHFYSDFGTLERIIENVNATSKEYSQAEVFRGSKDAVLPRLLAGLGELQSQIPKFKARLDTLRAKLPS